jgi:DMSO/TMAO reductase YedYZ heme-binding membrane subunit
VNGSWSGLDRATGIVAALLAVAALVGGSFFSSRNTGTRRRPNWWLDLHNWLGGLTLVFTLVHVAAAYVDGRFDLGLAQLVVPATATSSRWAITWGVLAMDVFALTVFTTWPRRRFSRRTWRAVHLLSVPATVLVGLHAYGVGSEATSVAFLLVSVACGGLAVYAIAVRLLALLARRGDDQDSQLAPR